jgi:hypothetical protein
MKGHRGEPVAAGSCKLGAAYPVETDGHGWQAAPTTTERASTVRWPGSGKRDGKVYVRNQRPNASQEQTTSSNLADLGWAAARTRALARRTPWLVNVAGREATGKACGVPVARLQGQSWSPNPMSGPQVNVGTILAAPSPVSMMLVGGKARRRLMPPGWGVGLVVVVALTLHRGGRESRPQGEGVQQVRSMHAWWEGRW